MNNKGQLSAELMVAIGVIGLISLAVTQLGQDSVKGALTLKQIGGLRDHIKRVARVTQDKKSCDANFIGKSEGSSLPSLVKVKSDGTKVPISNMKVGDKFEGLTLSSIRIEKIIAMGEYSLVRLSLNYDQSMKDYQRRKNLAFYMFSW